MEKKIKKIRLHSEAFPPLSTTGEREKIYALSEFHNAFKNPYFTIDPKNITFASLDKSHIDEVMTLHQEWFPIKYDKSFFEVTLNQNNSNYYSIGALYKDPDGGHDMILGMALVEFQEISTKFKHHTSQDILKKISNQINFFDEMTTLLSFNDYHCGYIMTIGVLDECRRMGLGSILLRKIVKACLDDSLCVCIYLDVVTYNEAAIKFYKKNNFVETNEIKNYYHIGEEVYDSKVFCRVLTNKEKQEYKNKSKPICLRFAEITLILQVGKGKQAEL